ncbi:hypothetical protein BDV39DRAFT_187902 [Aspergillus sergii]|uniref:Uncharacterized protein n=1 Tax=Aspergillus sergii TaxID=1034303 RepID=A0A5N6WI02_9EURO|nr:hypothetical protein BDV39DRAFT_187902 [Aspergillus sergii]
MLFAWGLRSGGVHVSLTRKTYVLVLFYSFCGFPSMEYILSFTIYLDGTHVLLTVCIVLDEILVI